MSQISQSNKIKIKFQINTIQETQIKRNLKIKNKLPQFKILKNKFYLKKMKKKFNKVHQDNLKKRKIEVNSYHNKIN